MTAPSGKRFSVPRFGAWVEDPTVTPPSYSGVFDAAKLRRFGVPSSAAKDDRAGEEVESPLEKKRQEKLREAAAVKSIHESGLPRPQDAAPPRQSAAARVPDSTPGGNSLATDASPKPAWKVYSRPLPPHGAALPPQKLPAEVHRQPRDVPTEAPPASPRIRIPPLSIAAEILAREEELLPASSPRASTAARGGSQGSSPRATTRTGQSPRSVRSPSPRGRPGTLGGGTISRTESSQSDWDSVSPSQSGRRGSNRESPVSAEGPPSSERRGRAALNGRASPRGTLPREEGRPFVRPQPLMVDVLGKAKPSLGDDVVPESPSKGIPRFGSWDLSNSDAEDGLTVQFERKMELRRHGSDASHASCSPRSGGRNMHGVCAREAPASAKISIYDPIDPMPADLKTHHPARGASPQRPVGVQLDAALDSPSKVSQKRLQRRNSPSDLKDGLAAGMPPRGGESPQRRGSSEGMSPGRGYERGGTNWAAPPLSPLRGASPDRRRPTQAQPQPGPPSDAPFKRANSHQPQAKASASPPQRPPPAVPQRAPGGPSLSKVEPGTVVGPANAPLRQGGGALNGNSLQQRPGGLVVGPTQRDPFAGSTRPTEVGGPAAGNGKEAALPSVDRRQTAAAKPSSTPSADVHANRAAVPPQPVHTPTFGKWKDKEESKDSSYTRAFGAMRKDKDKGGGGEGDAESTPWSPAAEAAMRRLQKDSGGSAPPGSATAKVAPEYQRDRAAAYKKATPVYVEPARKKKASGGQSFCCFVVNDRD